MLFRQCLLTFAIELHDIYPGKVIKWLLTSVQAKLLPNSNLLWLQQIDNCLSVYNHGAKLRWRCAMDLRTKKIAIFVKILLLSGKTLT